MAASAFASATAASALTAASAAVFSADDVMDWRGRRTALPATASETAASDDVSCLVSSGASCRQQRRVPEVNSIAEGVKSFAEDVKNITCFGCLGAMIASWIREGLAFPC